MYVGQLKSHVLQFLGYWAKLAQNGGETGTMKSFFLATGQSGIKFGKTRVSLSGRAITIE